MHVGPTVGDTTYKSPNFLYRFSEENFPKNLELVKKFNDLASARGIPASQLVLAWVLYQVYTQRK